MQKLFHTNQNGQVIIILLLITLVALTIGLTITQRTVTDVSTSTQNEQASRSFSAAEAGIEKALKQCPPGTPGCTLSAAAIPLGNESSAEVKVSPPLPIQYPSSGLTSPQALEYPPVDKETIAQVWLVSPDDITSQQYPANQQLSVYWGNPNPTDPNSVDTPAIEITWIGRSNVDGSYKTKRYLYDPLLSRRALNRFDDPGCAVSAAGGDIHTSNSSKIGVSDRSFRCKVDLNPATATELTNTRPIMLRLRILYSTTSQRVAAKPIGNFNLPTQATIYTSIGKSGLSEKTVQVFSLKKVVPAYFDFALFAAGEIKKQF